MLTTTPEHIIHEKRFNQRVKYIREKESKSISDLLELSRLVPEEFDDTAIENKIRDVMHKLISVSAMKWNQELVEVRVLKETMKE